jgi:hypothetical protein
MVVGESADFMRCTFDPGKTYYVLVTPRLGWLTGRFSLKPVRATELTTPSFTEWNKTMRFVETTSASRAWAAKNAATIQKKREEYFRKWSGGTPAELAECTLLASDGT